MYIYLSTASAAISVRNPLDKERLPEVSELNVRFCLFVRISYLPTINSGRRVMF